jgi:hypothetical protein
MTYEQRRDLLLETMKRQTDNWLKGDQYEEWQKKNKPKKSYTFKPKVYVRTKDIYDKECLRQYYQSR